MNGSQKVCTTMRTYESMIGIYFSEYLAFNQFYYTSYI